MKLLTNTIFIAILFITASCVNIKSEYPEIKYYDIQTGNVGNITESLPASLQMRSLSISSIYNTNQFIVKKENARLSKYFYHRWTTDPSDLVTDKIINYLNKSEVFENGVFSSSSMVVPDYILEGEIIEISAENNEDEEKYFVNLEIKLSLIKRIKRQSSDEFLFTKTYTERISREDEEIELIPISIGKALTNISNELLEDIIKSIEDA